MAEHSEMRAHSNGLTQRARRSRQSGADTGQRASLQHGGSLSCWRQRCKSQTDRPLTDFLDAEALLSSHQRAEFTAPESVNATGQLSEGRKVAVKGLHITSVEPHRINLTSLLSRADTCR